VTYTHGGFAYRFDRAFMALDAAVQGLGVALESTSIGEPHLRKGKLRPVFDPDWFLPVQAHFLVYPARHAQRSEVISFVDWLRDRAGSP
jgi:LysR family glycine cleavage system transcriptional activator